MDQRTCRDCGQMLDESAFWPSQWNLPPHHRPCCKSCRNRRPAVVRGSCKDCGTTDGMDWWVARGGSYLFRGNHVYRCEPCHDECRIKAPARPCGDCGSLLERGSRNQRCQLCSYERRRRLDRERERLRPRRKRPPGNWTRRCLCGTKFTSTDVRKYCSTGCPARVGYGPPSPGLIPVPVVCRRCVVCDVVLTGKRTKVCSDECQRGRICDRVMGLYRAAFETGRVTQAMHWRYELVTYLRERDGDDCQLCGKRMDFEVSTGPRGESDQGATVDHVAPWSLTQDDSLANLKLAHWSCNNGKRASVHGDGEQLRLIG